MQPCEKARKQGLCTQGHGNVGVDLRTGGPWHSIPHLLARKKVAKYADCVLLLQINAEWACREKEALSTCEALMALADAKKVDLLVVGSWGRKGEKL